MSPSKPPKHYTGGKPTGAEKEKQRNHEASAMHATPLAGPSDNQPHDGKWQKARQNAKKWFDNTIWFFGDPTRALAFLTLLLVGIGLGTLCIQRDTEERQLRAYVGIQIPDDFSQNDAIPPKLPSFKLGIKNFGQTPAYRVTYKQGATFAAFPLPANFGFVFSKGSDPDPTPITIFPGSSPGLGITADLRQPLTQDQVTALEGPNERLYLYGTVWYLDAFTEPHWTNWCLAVSLEVAQDGKRSVRRSSCSRHNETDQG